MSTLIANHSTYPRIGDRPEQQALRRAVDQWEKKEISEDDLDHVLKVSTADVLAEQGRAGVELVTDGGLRRYDPISHCLREIRGVRLGRLARFLDTNTYYRVPRVQKPLIRREYQTVSCVHKDAVSAHETLRASPARSARLKVFWTGPVTLSLCCERDKGFKNLEDLVQEFAALMAEEVRSLGTEGIPWIQIEEPMILHRPELFPILSKSLRKITSKKGCVRIMLATYFADATPHYSKLQALPVDGLGLDYISSPALLDTLVSKGSDKALALGVIDGRVSGRESHSAIEKMARQIRRIRMLLDNNKEESARELHLTTSCGLEYLPRGTAFEKLTLLAKLKELIQ